MGTPPEHSLVWEDTGDATICGCEDSQETVPAGRGGDAEAGLRCVPVPCPSPSMSPTPSVPTSPGTATGKGPLSPAYVLRSWSFQTRSTSCCVMPVSRIRLCRRKLSPWERSSMR